MKRIYKVGNFFTDDYRLAYALGGNPEPVKLFEDGEFPNVDTAMKALGATHRRPKRLKIKEKAGGKTQTTEHLGVTIFKKVGDFEAAVDLQIMGIRDLWVRVADGEKPILAFGGDE